MSDLSEPDCKSCLKSISGVCWRHNETGRAYFAAAPSPGNREQALREAHDKWWREKGNKFSQWTTFGASEQGFLAGAALSTQGTECSCDDLSVRSRNDCPVHAKEVNMTRPDPRDKQQPGAASGEPTREVGTSAGEFDKVSHSALEKVVGILNAIVFGRRVEIAYADEVLAELLAAGPAALPLQREAVCQFHQRHMHFCEECLGDRIKKHSKDVQWFLLDMYQTMVDPVEEFGGNIADLCALLLKRAREDRQALEDRAPLQPQVEELRMLSEKATPGPWTLSLNAKYIRRSAHGFNILTAEQDDTGPFDTALAAMAVNLIRKWLAPTEEGK